MNEKIDNLLKDYQKQIYLNFEKIVNVNSFTSNLDGINKVRDMLINMAKENDICLDTVYSAKKVRPHLMYNKNEKDDYYAFVGHFDTVHPLSSDFNTFEEKDGIIKGPGTNDMKQGLIVALYSLIILKKLYPNKKLPIKILFNSDEETGSNDSKEIIQKEFINAKAGFIFEPGRSNGGIVTRRKGIALLDIEIFGKPAHSGVEPWNGINSLLVSCEIIQKLEALNDYKEGIIVGCNELHSGVARNVVPAYSKISVDIRFSNLEQQKNLFENIKNILNEKNKLGAKVKYNLKLNRPPLVMNEKAKKLSKLYRDISKSLGYNCEEVSTGGGSDGNFLSSMGIAVLDGLGAVGDFSHTKKEYTKKDSLLYRTKIFVLFMSKLLNKKESL